MLSQSTRDTRNAHTQLFGPPPILILARDRCNLYRNWCHASECIASSRDFRSRFSSTWQSDSDRRFSLLCRNRTALGWWPSDGSTSRICSGSSGDEFWKLATTIRWYVCLRAVRFRLQKEKQNMLEYWSIVYVVAIKDARGYRKHFTFSHFLLELFQRRFNQFPAIWRWFAATTDLWHFVKRRWKLWFYVKKSSRTLWNCK